MSETEQTTEKQLGRHIVTAINAIQKQIDKYEKQVFHLRAKAGQLETDADILVDEMQGLREQISKLKGEI